MLKLNSYVRIICHNDDLCLSLTWLDCVFAEINQILLNIYFIHILLTFMYLVALYQKTEL